MDADDNTMQATAMDIIARGYTLNRRHREACASSAAPFLSPHSLLCGTIKACSLDQVPGPRLSETFMPWYRSRPTCSMPVSAATNIIPWRCATQYPYNCLEGRC